MAEVLAELVPGPEGRGAQRVERVDHVGLVGVEIGQLIPAPVGDAVDEGEEDFGATSASRPGSGCRRWCSTG